MCTSIITLHERNASTQLLDDWCGSLLAVVLNNHSYFITVTSTPGHTFPFVFTMSFFIQISFGFVAQMQIKQYCAFLCFS